MATRPGTRQGHAAEQVARSPAASGAALMLLTGMACPNAGVAGAPDQATGTDNLPPIEPAPPNAATGCAAAAPPPSMPPNPPRPGNALAAAGAAPPMAPTDLAIWVNVLAIPVLKYGNPSVL
ncbi:hypothetical protein I549_3407 [Mycobacterium avium subsp. avium 2285 (R)]|nr:hypothetical protein I549_3407 [Mycobacterium avium subsp. avium 2285 (R)]